MKGRERTSLGRHPRSEIDPTRTSLRTFDTETGVAEAGLALDGLAKNFRRLETATRGDDVKSEP